MSIELSQFQNVFDIFFLSIITLSTLFSLKNGLIKSIFNLLKWLVIIYSIRISFVYLRDPFDDFLGSWSGLTDILIFISIFTTSFVLITLLNRLIIGLINSQQPGAVDRLLGLIFGMIRGYIIATLVFAVLNNWSFSKGAIESYQNSSVMHLYINEGNNFFKTIPKKIEKKLESI